jgi:hypothetical protein
MAQENPLLDTRGAEDLVVMKEVTDMTQDREEALEHNVKFYIFN